MRPSFSGAKLALLHVNDNAGESALIQEAIDHSHTPFTLYAAQGVQPATGYFQFPAHAPYAHPDLVLLDFDTFPRTGSDFLYWLRVQKNMTAIPVIMYSGSHPLNRISQSYAAGANHFLSKASELSRIVAIVQTLYYCMSFRTPQFGSLTRLPEYRAEPKSPT